MRLSRWLARLNLVATLILLGALFILINFLATRHYLRRDLTKTQISTLSEKTRQVLAQVTAPVRVIVFYQPSFRLYELVQDLLIEYEAASPQIQVEYIDPDQDMARAQQLATQFEIDRLNLVIFESGGRHKYLSDTELAQYDYSQPLHDDPPIQAFEGEAAFTSAILNLTQASRPRIWFTTGHGEKDLEDTAPLGLSGLQGYLEKENMDIESVSLLEASPEQIPETVSAIIIAGPTRRFVEAEVALLQDYLARGGRVLGLIDPIVQTGLEGLFSRWGIELGQDIVVDPTRQLPFVSAANVFVTTYTQHPIVEHMQTFMTLFPLARSVQPSATLPTGLTATPLALTSPEGWGETRTEETTFEFDEGDDTPGPVSLAAAAEQDAEVPTRLVVVGDSDFVSNAQLSNVGNMDLVLGCVHWLVAQEELIGISPKTLGGIKLSLTAKELNMVRLFSMFLLPGLLGVLGGGMWWSRRT